MTLDERVAAAKERIHRSIGQRARADFLRKLRILRGQAMFLRGG